MASGIPTPLLEVSGVRGHGPSDIFHQRTNKHMSELKGCVFVSATGLWVLCFPSRAGGQVVSGCSEDLSCESPHCGADSGCVARAHRQGQSLSCLQSCSLFQEMGVALSFPVQHH